MDIFHRLPTELRFEVLILLDCRTLVTLLTLYPLLQKRVVIITQCSHRELLRSRTTKRSKHSIKTLLPEAQHATLDDIPRSVPTHAYLKIFEVSPDIWSLRGPAIRHFNYNRYGLRQVHGVGPEREIHAKTSDWCDLWLKLMKYMDRNSVLTCSQDANGFDFVKGWLLQLSWITGATYHPFSPLLDLVVDTPLPKHPHSSLLDSLTLIKATVNDNFNMPTVGLVRTLSVEFTCREGQQPKFTVNSAENLNTIRILYHGELVPWVSLEKCLFNHPYDLDVFELTRLHTEQSLTSNNNASAHRRAYKGDLWFVNSCSEVSFSGVPDWLVFMCSYTSLITFKWYRTDPTTVKISRSKKPPRLYMPKLRELHVCSMIKHDSLPLISHTKRESKDKLPLKRLGILNIVIGAPGMNLNGLLSSSGNFDTLLIRAHQTTSDTPALSLTEADLMSLSSERLLLEGDIDLTQVLSSTCQRKSRYDDEEPLWIAMADLDLTTTARNSANGFVDLGSMPLGSPDNFSSVRITCSPNQPITLALHKALAQFCSDVTLEKLVDLVNKEPKYYPDIHDNPELFLSWNMIHSTSFEGVPIVSDDFTRSGRAMDLEYAHFLFDPETQSYVFCDVCFDCEYRFRKLA